MIAALTSERTSQGLRFGGGWPTKPVSHRFDAASRLIAQRVLESLASSSVKFRHHDSF
jgi:hypothetical protein